jgi:arsenate reductase
MAEAFLNALHGDRYEGYSAGIKPTKVNPYVLIALSEIGIDISTLRSKSIEEFRGETFDCVITVCDKAKESCPFFPSEKILHKSFKDPTQFKGADEEVLEETRRVRDEIKHWVQKTFRKTDSQLGSR